MSYKSRLNCPVCGEMMDEITHPDEKPDGFGTALVASDCRREHLEKSPACQDDVKWVMGWDIVPVPNPQ